MIFSSFCYYRNVLVGGWIVWMIFLSQRIHAQSADTTKKAPKSTLETTVSYGSKGKMNFNVLRQTMYLYDKAFVTFGNKTLNADVIELSWATNTVRAYGKKDSLGNVTGEPVFTENQTVYNAQEIIYNYRTEKGIIRGILTEQGDGYVVGQKVKKTPTDEFYLHDAIYTTCKAEHPHYAIHARRLKMVPNKFVISGPFNMEINQVPLPIGFPLGMFPVSAKRASGIIVPQYGEQRGVGFFLRGGGVYLAVSDYVGVKLTGDIYSLGGWLLSGDIQYKRRYYFDGAMNASYRRIKVQNPDGTATITPNYQFTWNHRPVPRGAGQFSANVSIMSADFRRNNSRSTTEYISATVNSGVMYNTHFFNKLFSFSTNARINQNLLTKVTTLSPDLNLSMQRIFPFKKEGDTRKNLLTDFNFSYGANAKAEVSNVGGIRTLSSAPEVVLLNGRYVSKNDVIKNIKQDTLDLFGHLPRYLKNTRFGMQHNLQASTNVTILKYFTGSLNFNYIEKWHPEQYRYRWIEQAKGVKVDTLRTFARTYEYNFSTSVQTRFYGFYSLKNGIQMRQQFAPTVGLSYRPDFSEPQFGMFQQVQVNSDGSTRRIAYTEGSFAGAASQGKSFSMNFGLASQLEGKVKKKQTGKDTTAVTEKIKILDNISVSTSYNFLADSFNLADIAMGTRTMLFDLIDINLQGVTLDPYYYAPLARSGREPSNAPTRYRRTPTYAFQAGKGIGIIKSATLAVGFRLSPATFKKKNVQQQSGGGQTTTQKKVEEEDNPILEDIRRNPDRYLNFNIPWSLNVSYSIRYNKSPDLTRTDYTQVIEFNGDFSLTPKWKITYRSGYDFQKKDFAFTNFGIVRDLHCWTMTVNWVPFGPRQSYTFDLAVRSSILQDLKISKRNDWYDTGVSANASRR